MGIVTNKNNINLGKELNDMVSSLGYEIVIEPPDEDEIEEDQKENTEE